MYKVINYIVRPKYKGWEGAIIEDIKTNKKYITNGVGKWEARPERLETCKIVNSIDVEKFYERWKRNINMKLFKFC